MVLEASVRGDCHFADRPGFQHRQRDFRSANSVRWTDSFDPVFVLVYQEPETLNFCC